MASTGEAVSYRDFEARCNKLAHLLRAYGLERLDHMSILMENNDRYLEACSAGGAIRLVLHAGQLLPDGRGGRVHRRQQRIEGADHVAREARRRARRGGRLPAARTRAHRRRRRRRAPTRASTTTRPPSPISRRRRSPTSGSERRCSTRPVRPGARRASLRPLPDVPPAKPLGAAVVPHRVVAVPGGHGVPLAGAAVPLGAADGGRTDHRHRRDGRSSWSASIR